MGELIPYHFGPDEQLKKGTGKAYGHYFYIPFKDMKAIPVSVQTTWFCLLRQWKTTNKDWVSIPKYVRDAVNLDRRKLSRDLATLERYKFIELKRETGKPVKSRRTEHEK